MGKAIVNDLDFSVKNTRAYYADAYKALRLFYRACNSGDYTDDQLMRFKLELWFMYGRYLDLVWQHHFAWQVAKTEAACLSQGWKNKARYFQFSERWNLLAEHDNLSQSWE